MGRYNWHPIFYSWGNGDPGKLNTTNKREEQGLITRRSPPELTFWDTTALKGKVRLDKNEWVLVTMVMIPAKHYWDFNSAMPSTYMTLLHSHGSPKKYYYLTHFTDGKTEDPKGQITCWGSMWQMQDLNLANSRVIATGLKGTLWRKNMDKGRKGTNVATHWETAQRGPVWPRQATTMSGTTCHESLHWIG